MYIYIYICVCVYKYIYIYTRGGSKPLWLNPGRNGKVVETGRLSTVIGACYASLMISPTGQIRPL